MSFQKFIRACAVCLLLAAVSSPAQISVSGVAHKGVYADTVTFTIASQGGFTYTAFLNTNTVPVGTAVTVNRADFYQLYITRTDGVTAIETNIYFIVRASARGGTEWGLPVHTPWPVIASSSSEFEGAKLRVLVPANFPAGYEVPVVAWVLDGSERAVRANGALAAAGQNPIGIKRGVGSGFLASNQPPGMLNYAPSIGGVTTNKSINIESSTTWTTVSGTLAGATTWAASSRIRVTGHVAIPAGSTLTVGAGSVVLLNAGVNITNDGAVNINGTVEQPVVFMPNSRNQPWGGFFMRTSSGSVNGTGVIFVASGADPNGGAGHRDEQCLFLVDNAPSVTLTDSAAIHLAGQFGHAYGGGTFTFTRFLLQRATTGGEYTGATWRVNDSAFIDFPDDAATYVDGDNDALYFVSTPVSGGINFTNTLFGWTKDDGIDSGGSGYGPLRYQNCWFEATFHEGNSLSGYKDTRAWDTVYINCGQGLEDGYDAPTGRVERCLFTTCQSGLRHGDNYSTFSGYSGLLTATNCISIFNHRDLFGFNWDDQGGWTNNWGRLLAGNNWLTRADTNFPNNLVWNPASDAWRLGAFGGKGRVGVALAVRPGQSALAGFSDGIPVGLSIYCTNEVTVDYSVDGTGGTHLTGTLRFVPGETQKYIPVPTGATGVLQVVIANPVNADLTGVDTLLFQNIAPPPPPPSTVLSPLGATWKYLDNGSEQGTAWRATGFNDAAWASGPARLGFGSDQAPLATTLRRYVTGTSGPQITNAYFRRAFTVTNPGAYATLQFRYQRDDGVVVYLNSNEVFRSNMPTGAISATNFATSTVSGATAALAYYTNSVAATNLVDGINVIAASVHQVNGTSSDIGWDCEVTGAPPFSPGVSISRLGSNAVIYWTDSTFRLEQSDSVSGGSWTPAGTNSPVAVSPAEQMRIFRLRK